LNSPETLRFRTVTCLAAIVALTALGVRTAEGALAGPPSISKAFGAASISVGGTTTLTFTIENDNGFAITGVAFTDSLPVGLTVAGTPGVSSTCGGTVTAVANSTSITLTGGTVPAGFGGTCTISVNVTGVTSGMKVNVSGAVSATEGGTGNTATASITVLDPTPTGTPTETPTVTPTGTPVPQGGACSVSSQCATSFCADAVCCDTACDGPREQCHLPGQVGTCASVTEPAPALTPWGLLMAALLLTTIAALALRRAARGR
jgi:uncharacterized repeat protein (TIGR01451 family)